MKYLSLELLASFKESPCRIPERILLLRLKIQTRRLDSGPLHLKPIGYILSTFTDQIQQF